LLQDKEGLRRIGDGSDHGSDSFMDFPKVLEGDLRLRLPERFFQFFPEKVFLPPLLPNGFEFRQFRRNRVKECFNPLFFIQNELLDFDQAIDVPGSWVPHPCNPFAELTQPVFSLADLLAVS